MRYFASGGHQNTKIPEINAKIDYYDILSCKYGDHDSIIKKNFYELAKKYHPDTLESDVKQKKIVLTPDIKQLYEEKFKRISAAYEILGD